MLISARYRQIRRPRHRPPLQHYEAMADRLTLLDPTSYEPLTLYVWAVAFLLGVGLCVHTKVYRRVELLSTMVHELGHGIGGLAAGRKFEAFQLHPDASGVAYTRGRGKLGLIYCFWAGYSAPATVALLLIASIAAGAPSWAYPVCGVVLALSLFRARTWLAFSSVAVTLVVSAVVWWFTGPVVHIGVIAALAGYFFSAGTRQIRDAWVQKDRDGGTADADQLEKLTRIPEVAWLVLFYVHTSVCVALSCVLFVMAARG